jgi:type IV pilus assembly protein PilW
MNELTGVPGAGGNCGSPASGGSDVLNHNTGQYKNPNVNCQMVSPTHNNASGIKDPSGNTVPPLSQANGGQLFDLGALPQIKVYAIRGGSLTVCDMLNTNCTVASNYVVLVDNIVSMRAIYGQDFAGSPPAGSSLPGDGVVDRWSRAPLATTNDISRTLAAGIEITSRSGLKEKPKSGTTCDATSTASRPDRGQTQDWFQPYVALASGSLTGAQIDLSSVSADWQCYRYKLFQTSVPLRNMIWRP